VTPARLLLDEMLSPKIGAALEAHGHDVAVVTQRPDLMALHDDEPILAAAAAEDRVIVTANIGDFAALDAQWTAEGRAHAGIVLVSSSQFPQDLSFIGRVANAVLDAAETGALPGRSQALYLRPADPPQA
jgi:hypothetical protein